MNKYEKAWIAVSLILLALFLSILGYFGFAAGLQTPKEAGVIDPANLAADPNFSNPRVEEIIPGREYAVYMVAKQYVFIPSEIVIPRGAKVTFYITSADVVHGFQIIGTNVQTMVFPGYIAKVSAIFEKSGEYIIICNEYCGSGHHLMTAKLLVV